MDHNTHDHSHAAHGPSPGEGKPRGGHRLGWVLAVNAGFMLLEAVGGYLANSLALLADAGHMLTDVAALALALAVARLGRQPATPRRTFGLLRAEVMGAFINGASLVILVGFIFYEAWQRFGTQAEVDGPLMLAVATAGLLVNGGSVWLLARNRSEDLNLHAAFLHMAADTLGSLGAIVAGVIVWRTGWTPIDPIVSVFIGALILWSSLGLLRQTMNILLEATPAHIDYQEVRHALESLEHVAAVHDLHIWTIASGIPALSVHLTLAPDCSSTTHWQLCLRHAQDMLRERFGIVHSTLQLEPPGHARDDRVI